MRKTFSGKWKAS